MGHNVTWHVSTSCVHSPPPLPPPSLSLSTKSPKSLNFKTYIYSSYLTCFNLLTLFSSLSLSPLFLFLSLDKNYSLSLSLMEARKQKS